MGVDWLTAGVGMSLICALAAIISLGLSHGALLPVRTGTSGYWGKISSSVDWCEENYTHSHYVAETWNTVTSCIIAAVGLIGAHNARCCGAEFRYELLGYLLCVIGLGSVAFHMALQHWMQMLDEVPMLWAAVAATYCILNNKAPLHGGNRGSWLLVLLTAWTVLISCVTIFFKGTVQVFAFHLSFGSAELVSLYDSYRVMRQTNDPQTARICRAGFAMFAISVLSWSIDGLACSQLQRLPFSLPNPQLHAFGWHGGVSAATYLLLLATMRERLEFLGKQPYWVWKAGVFPLLRVKNKGAVGSAALNGRNKQTHAD